MKSVLTTPKVSCLLILGISSAMICLSQISIDPASSQEIPASNDSAPKLDKVSPPTPDPRVERARVQLEESNKKDIEAKEAYQKRVLENRNNAGKTIDDYQKDESRR